jgi:hypothetical protein
VSVLLLALQVSAPAADTGSIPAGAFRLRYPVEGTGTPTSPIRRLFSDGQVHATVNANGALVLDRVEILGLRCDKK